MVTTIAWDKILKSRYREYYSIKQADKEYIRNRRNKTKQIHKETLQKKQKKKKKKNNTKPDKRVH